MTKSQPTLDPPDDGVDRLSTWGCQTGYLAACTVKRSDRTKDRHVPPSHAGSPSPMSMHITALWGKTSHAMQSVQPVGLWMPESCCGSGKVSSRLRCTRQLGGVLPPPEHEAYSLLWFTVSSFFHLCHLAFTAIGQRTAGAALVWQQWAAPTVVQHHVPLGRRCGYVPTCSPGQASCNEDIYCALTPMHLSFKV